MNPSHKIGLLLPSALIAVVSIAYVFNYMNFAVVYGEGLGQLARAESAQTPTELIEHVSAAKTLLPEHGNAGWWASEASEFKEIRLELDNIVNRAQAISDFDLGNEHHVSEMLELHAKLKNIEERIITICELC